MEELGGREGGGGGGGTKPVEKPGAAQFARPLRGAEVLVAVRGPSPGPRGGGKNPSKADDRVDGRGHHGRPSRKPGEARVRDNEPMLGCK